MDDGSIIAQLPLGQRVIDTYGAPHWHYHRADLHRVLLNACVDPGGAGPVVAEVGGTEPRQALVLVEWRDRDAFDAFLADHELADLHPLRENGTRRYIWWTFDRLDDLRPLLRR